MRSAWVIGDSGRRCSSESSEVSCGSGRTQGAGDQILGAVAVQVAQQFVSLKRVVTESDQSLVRERSGTVVCSSNGSHALERTFHPYLLAQLDDDALGRALADAGHRLKARGVGARDRGQQLAWRAA